MAQTTGPILVAGGITWANSTLLDDNPNNLFEETVRIGVATGVLCGIMYGMERLSSGIAVGLSWAMLGTVLLVRIKPGTPTPLERGLKLIGG